MPSPYVRRIYNTSIYPSQVYLVTDGRLEAMQKELESLGMKSLPVQATRFSRCWAVTLPLGLASGRLVNPETLSPVERKAVEDADCAAMLNALCKAEAEAVIPRHVLRNRPTRIDNKWFVSLGSFDWVWTLFREKGRWIDLIKAFSTLAVTKPNLIAPEEARKPHRRPVAPMRAPNWTREEDEILYRWFGPQAADGHRNKMNGKDDWKSLLESLHGQRTKEQVRQRLNVLNTQLRASISLGAFTPAQLEEYLSKRLGQNKGSVTRSVQLARTGAPKPAVEPAPEPVIEMIEPPEPAPAASPMDPLPPG